MTFKRGDKVLMELSAVENTVEIVSGDILMVDKEHAIVRVIIPGRKKDLIEEMRVPLKDLTPHQPL